MLASGNIQRVLVMVEVQHGLALDEVLGWLVERKMKVLVSQRRPKIVKANDDGVSECGKMIV